MPDPAGKYTKATGPNSSSFCSVVCSLPGPHLARHAKVKTFTFFQLHVLDGIVLDTAGTTYQAWYHPSLPWILGTGGQA